MRKAVIIFAWLTVACAAVFAQDTYLQAEILSNETQCILNKDFSAEIVHASIIHNQCLYFTLADGRLIQLNLRNFKIEQRIIGQWCHLPPQLYHDLIAVVGNGSNIVFLDEELSLVQEMYYSNYLASPPFFFDSVMAVHFENGSLQIFDTLDGAYNAHYYLPPFHSKPEYHSDGYLEIRTDTETYDSSFNWYLYESDGTIAYTANINELPFRESEQNKNCRLSSSAFIYDGTIFQFTSTGLKIFKPRNRTSLSEMIEDRPDGSEIRISIQPEQPAALIAANRFFYISSQLSEPRLGYYRLNILNPVNGEILQSFTTLQDTTYSNIRDIDSDGTPELIIIQDFGTIYSTNRQQRLVWHDIYTWNSNRMAFEWTSIQYPDYYTVMIAYYNQAIGSPPFINQFYAGEYARWAAAALDMANSVVTIERQVRQQQSSPHRNNQRYRSELAKWYTDWGITAYRRSFDNLALFSFQQALSIQPKSVKIHYYIGKIYEQYGLWDKAAMAYSAGTLYDFSDTIFYCQHNYDQLMLDEERSVPGSISALDCSMAYGEALFNSGNYTAALNQYELILQKNPSLERTDKKFYLFSLYQLASLYQMRPATYMKSYTAWQIYLQKGGSPFDDSTQQLIQSYLNMLEAGGTRRSDE